jgi:cytochrome b561
MIVSHMSLGILLSAVVIVRIVWRLIPGHQVALPSLHLSRFRGGARLRVALVR